MAGRPPDTRGWAVTVARQTWTMSGTEPQIFGRELRYRLSVMLRDAHRPMKVHEMIVTLRSGGLGVRGRSSKAISDALRWEIRRGRVVRVGRATYVTGRIPPSTLRWIRRWLENRADEWAAHLTGSGATGEERYAADNFDHGILEALGERGAETMAEP